VAAAYRHRMSRALDPQLHTHVVAANVACGSDGRWTALHGHKLYTHAKNAGFLYQAHLRAEVRERLGLEWGPVVKGAAELVDVSPDVLAHFSTRSREAREAAAEVGQELDSWERRNHWALKTRERKQYGVDTHTWHRRSAPARASTAWTVRRSMRCWSAVAPTRASARTARAPSARSAIASAGPAG
jgi:conjugative relaxase-like TrwC/TraI family protein